MNFLARRVLSSLPVAFAMILLLCSAQSASAEDTIVITLPHEIKRSSMLVIDLNGDGKQEILGGTEDGHVLMLDGSTYQVVWNKNMADYLPNYDRTRIQSSLAAADLNNDGKIELVVATGGADPVDGNGPGAVIVLTYQGAPDYFQLMPGWPAMAKDELGANSARPDGHPDGFTSTPALGDIDGDGNLEIVIGGMDRRLHAFQHDGSYLPGWPLARDYLIYRESRSTAALFDMDGDGALDIFIGSNNYKIPSCANPYLFYGMKADTTPLPGFPVETTQNIESAPAIGDINGDGSLDIIFGTGDFNENCGQPSNGKKVYAIDRFGQPLPGWPVSTNANTLNAPALGDMDNDGKPEVVLHTHDTLYAWHGDGTLVQGFPVTGDYIPRHASPVLADVDGDGEIEVLLMSGHVYEANGQLKMQREKLQGMLVVTDQDGDGLLETLGANNYYWRDHHLLLFIYQETGAASAAQPWPMFHRTNDRAGVLPIMHSLSGRVVDEQGSPVAGVTITLNNGRSAGTNGQGVYTFGNLLPGTYTVTPSNGNNYFRPAERTVTLPTAAPVGDFVMFPPIFDIQGQVLQANNSGLPGVTLQLNSGATTTTDQNGNFSFDDQQPGEYTITPTGDHLKYQPNQLTVVAQEQRFHNFYAIPLPVDGRLEPNSTTQVEYLDTQGLPTRVLFPAGIGDQQVVLTPLFPEQPTAYLSTGHIFDISPSGADASVQPGIAEADAELPSFDIEIQYSQADLQSILKAEELVVLWKSPDGWVDALSTCTMPGQATHDLATSTITVSVCQWGTYGLFAPYSQMLMPLLFGK